MLKLAPVQVGRATRRLITEGAPPPRMIRAPALPCTPNVPLGTRTTLSPGPGSRGTLSGLSVSLMVLWGFVIASLSGAVC